VAFTKVTHPLFHSLEEWSFPGRRGQDQRGFGAAAFERCAGDAPWSDAWPDRTDLEFSTRPEAAESEVPL